MKRLMSIAAIALFVAGSSAFACGSDGCDPKKTDKSDKEQTACDGSKKGDQGKKTACNGSSHKHDGDKKKAA
jgi:hypothetical protein